MFLFDVGEESCVTEVCFSAGTLEISRFDGYEILVKGELLHDKTLQNNNLLNGKLVKLITYIM